MFYRQIRVYMHCFRQTHYTLEICIQNIPWLRGNMEFISSVEDNHDVYGDIGGSFNHYKTACIMALSCIIIITCFCCSCSYTSQTSYKLIFLQNGQQLKSAQENIKFFGYKSFVLQLTSDCVNLQQTHTQNNIYEFRVKCENV